MHFTSARIGESRNHRLAIEKDVADKFPVTAGSQKHHRAPEDEKAVGVLIEGSAYPFILPIGADRAGASHDLSFRFGQVNETSRKLKDGFQVASGIQGLR